MKDGSSSAPRPGDLLADKFRVLQRLGAGGMGTVLEVEHTLTKHRRALKLLHRGLMLTSPAAVPRFLREASAAGRIGNPHIVETFDAGQLPDGAPYIVMELLQGTSLARLIETQPAGLAFELAREIMCQVCDGIAAAHAVGIIHRDLKPENLFLVQRADGEATPHIKILDFGVSKFDVSREDEPKLTATGVALGTPLYMAPEQLIGDPALDARVDVYALGVVLYEMLVGQTPYPGPSVGQLVLQMHDAAFAPVCEQRPDLPKALDAIITRALAFEPAARFADVLQLRAALLGCELGALPTTPVSVRSVARVAQRTPHTTHVVQPAPRTAAWAGTAGLCALLLAAAWLTWGRAPAAPSSESRMDSANAATDPRPATTTERSPAVTQSTQQAPTELDPKQPSPLPAASTERAPRTALTDPAQPTASPLPAAAGERMQPAASTLPAAAGARPAAAKGRGRTRAAAQGIVEENPL